MNKKWFFCCGLLICFFLTACVSKEKYSQLEGELAETRAQIEKMTQRIDELELALRESSERGNRFEAELTAIRASKEDLAQMNTGLQAANEKLKNDAGGFQAEIATLRQQREDLEKENMDLHGTLNKLGHELQEKNLTVQQKESMIKEYNASRQQLEAGLLDQIKAREARIKEQQARISELDRKKNESENRLDDLSRQTNDLATQIDQKEQAIAELENTKHQIEANLQAKLEDRERTIAEQEKVIANLNRTKQEIETNLREQIKAHQVKLEEMKGKLKVTFIDKILFDSGSTEINARGQETLLKLAENLKANQNSLIVVEGHTDNVKIGPELKTKYPTNWELSVARAATVVRFLQQEAGVDPQRLTASGLSYYQPVAPNTTASGRSQNRRIEIILAPRI